MALIKSTGGNIDWTQVLMGAQSSIEIDVSTHYLTTVHIQGFIDTTDTTAHAGTEFIVLKSSTNLGDEDWQEHTRFTALVGTMNPEPQLHLTDPMPPGTTLIPVTSTTGYVAANVPMPWIAIHNLTRANSELALLASIAATPSITILKGTTNAHAKTVTLLGNIAFAESVIIDTLDLSRLLVIANNNFDSNGAIIDYKVRTTFTTGI